MSNKNIFKRTELKYFLTKKQYKRLLVTMKHYMTMDAYKRHKISNIYFDTPDFQIIRRSLEKPIYKEKLRIRKYNKNDFVFVELKKKYKGIVYKRRVAISDKQLNNNINNLNDDEQINREIKYFISCYDDIDARAYLSYDRDAYFSNDDEDLRMTFDFNIRFRVDDVSLDESENDNFVLDDDVVLLEVKTVFGYPKWFLDFLNENDIRKISFSKYGVAYKKFVCEMRG
ncbi:MAG: polyphosphate polymerase domain-containing protein [Mycoplasmatota bacterium]